MPTRTDMPHPPGGLELLPAGASLHANKYEQIRHICLYDYRTLDMPSFVPSSSRNPLAAQYIVPLDSLCATGDDAALRVERALRYLAGVETEGQPCEEGALFFLDPIITPIHNDAEWRTPADYPTRACEAIGVQAHSIAAYAYLRKYLANKEELCEIMADSVHRFPRPEYQERACVTDPVENIMKAACHATHAAAGQFVSPAVLLVGFAFKTLLKQLGLEMREFAQYRPLYRAVLRWSRAVSKVKKQKAADEVRKQDIWCSAIGCMAQTEQPGSKPRPRNCDCDSWQYCSKECQDQDWCRHQVVCKHSGVVGMPTTLTARQHAMLYNVLMLPRSEPIQRIEAVEEYEEKGDPRAGEVMFAFEMPCPFGTPGKRVRYVMKHYE